MAATDELLAPLLLVVLLFESVTLLLGLRLMSPPPPQAARVAANKFSANNFLMFMRFYSLVSSKVN